MITDHDDKYVPMIIDLIDEVQDINTKRKTKKGNEER